jgi:hypothetical protein
MRRQKVEGLPTSNQSGHGLELPVDVLVVGGTVDRLASNR